RLNGDINDYVQCKFVNAENVEVHDSGLVGNGAQGYMALSGMDANMIKQYEEGYEKWVDEYGATVLDKNRAENGILSFDIGVKNTDKETSKDQERLNWSDYTPMFLILGLGTVATVVSLIIYFVVRKKRMMKN
ncbi:MAG: hypothetical protein IJ295_01455, partial [Clostridia bacterium]|nr:hypothetical protein [Clostridia bacterium]